MSRVNPSITERLGELPDVGKVYTEYQGGFATVCAARIRGCVHSTRETDAPGLSSQVCTANEFIASVLMTFANLWGCNPQWQS